MWSPTSSEMRAGPKDKRGISVAVVSDDLPESAVALDVGTALDAGIKRKGQPNEDSLLALPSLRASRKSGQPLALFVVADGMGGHGNGQEASRLAIAALHDALQLALMDGLSDDIYEELLAESVHNANLAIHQRNRQKQADMGTTLTAALIAGNTAYIANVGDSRTYLLRKGELKPLTKDHSLVARLVEAKQIEPEDVYSHPQRNLIYRSLGAGHKNIDVDVFHVDLLAGDTLLLCTDGLWEMVRHEDLKKALSAPSSPQKICDTLIDLANANGGEDNITAVVVHVSTL